MHKTLVLAVVLLCGCVNPPARQFNQAQADHVRHVMKECARIVGQVSFLLTPAESDWHYQQCLVQNNATI